MTKEEFINNCHSYKEDRYTDFWFLRWYGIEDKIEYYYDLLIGDVTQIEQIEREQEDGFRYSIPIEVICKDGSKVNQSYGFVSSINKSPEINKTWFDYKKDRREGESSHDKLHHDKIYNEKDVDFIGVYQTRKMAFDIMVEHFWEINKKFITNIKIQ